MKKLFLLIPALVLSIVLNAATTPVSSGVNTLKSAVLDASSGDILELGDGIFYEEGNFDMNKDLTIKAAEGAHPVIANRYYLKIEGGADITFQGIKFDGAAWRNGNEDPIGASDYCFRSYSASTGEEDVQFIDCEFTGYPSYILYTQRADRRWNSITIRGCFFYNNKKSAVNINNESGEKQSCNALTIENSTFANFTESYDVIYYNAPDAEHTTTLSVNHCTFYGHPKRAIFWQKSENLSVSNCVFSQPSSVSYKSVECVAGTISNCLSYNSAGYSSAATRTDNIVLDPLFVDPANNDFSLAGDWTTMNISPARGAATDGSDLGDPRWYSAEVLPEVDFASPYIFMGSKAVFTGNIWYDGTNDYIYYNDKSENGTATWKINATRACALQATLNMNAETTTGHIFKVEIWDADGNSIGEAAEASQSSASGNIVLPGSIVLPAAGNYTVKLYNLQSWSSSKINSITLSYIGGDIQAMPGTTNIDDAWFSANGTRADGKIDFPDGNIQDGWVKWNVSFAEAANYKVNLTINSGNGKNYIIALQDADGNNIVEPLEKNGGDQGTPVTLEMGEMEVPVGNYILKVTNSTQWSDAELISVNFAYAGGAAIDLSKTTPASLLANADAIVSDDWTIEGGKITHAESKALTGWAKWNVNCADYGNYHVAVNISCDNGHGVRVEVFEDEAQPAIYTLDEPSAGKYHTGDLALDLGNILLADREYVVKVSNTVSSSHVQIASIVITYLNGAQATLPATFNFEDGMLSEKAHITAGELWFNTIGDSNPVGQWAKWNVKVAEAGTFLFTMNVSSTNGQSYKISILDGETEIDAFESGSVGSGDQIVKHYFNLAAGNYTVKLENTYAWSQGHIVSLAVTQPSLLVLDEAAETNTVIVDNYRNGTHDIQIIRTIVAGMYNTICLPFDVNSTQLKAIFGSDVELKQLNSAELNGDELDLVFEDVTSIYRGTPYLIQTSNNVVNPVFTNVEIKAEVGDATSGTNADFIGNFIKGEVPAGENNLFLGQNNLLYFSQTATPIKGMRAYFQVKGVSHPSNAIKHARIVMKDQVVTSINLVNDENKAVKTIENGQLIITIDGVRFNVMGTKIQ